MKTLTLSFLLLLTLLFTGCQTTGSNTKNLQLVSFAPVDRQSLEQPPPDGLIDVGKFQISAPKSGEFIGGFTRVTQTLRYGWSATAYNVGQSAHTVGYKLKDDIGSSVSGVLEKHFRIDSASNRTALVSLRPSMTNTIGKSFVSQYTYSRIQFEIVVEIAEDGQSLFKKFYKGAADQKVFFGDLSGDECTRLLQKAFQEALAHFQNDLPRDLEHSFKGRSRVSSL